jgi:hypothetical protein
VNAVELWESAMATRDSVFAQIFILSLIGYGALTRVKARAWKYGLMGVGLVVFVGLFIAAVLNVILWQPS